MLLIAENWHRVQGGERFCRTGMQPAVARGTSFVPMASCYIQPRSDVMASNIQGSAR